MQIDVARQRVLRAYVAQRRRIYQLVGIPIGAILGLVIGISRTRLQDFFNLFAVLNIAKWSPLLLWQPVRGWYALEVLTYYVVIVMLLEIVFIPLQFYVSYILPRRFKLKINELSAWKTFVEISKAHLRFTGWWALLIELFYLFFAIQPLTWWLWMALIQYILGLVSVGLAPVRLTRLYKVTPLLPDGEVAQRLRVLLARLGIVIHALVAIDKPGRKIMANAYITGWGRMRQIGITSRMLNNFTVDEIEVILAHELGHCVRHDIAKRLLIKFFLHLIEYLLIFALINSILPLDNIFVLKDVSGLPLLVVVIGLFQALGMGYYNGVARKQEREADEFALRTTGMVRAFKDAMVRMANTNLVLAEPGSSQSSHPPIVSRLRHADEFASRGAAVKERQPGEFV